jgi:alpha-tubulin suppressor-like RCC1 family protein
LVLSACSEGTIVTDGDVALDADTEVASCEGQSRSRCVRSLALGRRFGCAALRDRTVWCWGRNDESQLGYESSDLCPERLADGQTRAVACHRAPQQVTGLANVTAISAGGAHACAVLSNGDLRCWGGNTRGQLGTSTLLPSRAPLLVTGLGRARAVAAGAHHTCAVTDDGAVWCWGANDRGQLGAESLPGTCEVGELRVPCARAPVRVVGVSDAAEVVAGDAHTCARTHTGRVWCWGANHDGQLGAGTASATPAPRPVTVLLGESPLRGVRALAAGGEHTCATRSDDAVLCWGRHDRGQLGVAVPETFAPCAHACIPTAVPIEGHEGTPSPDGFDAGFKDLDVPAAEDDVHVALDATTRDAAADVPRDAARDAARDVTPDLPPTRADAALDAALDADLDATADADLDAAVDAGLPAAPTATGVAAGSAFSCLSLSDGTVRCWGTNRAYELGNGRGNEGGPALTAVIASPGAAATNPLQGVTRVASGLATSCALLQDRSVRCWGANEMGALGIGNLSEQNGPVAMTW